MNTALSMNEFQEEFGEIMLNGLDSRDTYIPLRQNKATGINFAIRPIVSRASSGVVIFGGKLRVGFTLDENHQPVKVSVTNLNEEAAVARLKEFGSGWAWLKQSAFRFSTICGFAFAASQYDWELAEVALTENELAKEFIERLERTYKQYNDGAKFQNKRRAIQALDAAWRMQATNVFRAMPQTVQLPPEIVGHQSKMLNEAQDSYGSNVVSFKDKVAAMAAQSAETETENAE